MRGRVKMFFVVVIVWSVFSFMGNVVVIEGQKYVFEFWIDDFFVKKVEGMNKDFIKGVDVFSVIVLENSGVIFFIILVVNVRIFL